MVKTPAQRRRYRQNHPDKIREQKARHRKKYPEKKREANRRYYLKRKLRGQTATFPVERLEQL